MEAMRAASAALASTSGLYHGPLKLASLEVNVVTPEYSPFVGREGSRRGKRQCRSQVVGAVARDLVNLSMNGSATKRTGTKGGGAAKLAGKKLDAPSFLTQDNPALNQLITALATAILEMDKRKKEQEKIEAGFGRGRLVENDFVYRQLFVIRSYEVGFDRTASIRTLSNLFQECALNHVGMSDFVGDGMGTTHAMMRHRLIWVVTRMQIQVERYPIWGDVVEIDTWVAAEGKNGMRRDWLVTGFKSREILARATSTWVTMNQDTRRLSKLPDDVRGEISPYFLDRWVMKDEPCSRTKKLGDDAPYVRSDLVPRLDDMDMNQHVNNVKYIAWVLESVPQSLSVAHELTSMVLEYKRECNPSDIVQSMTSPDNQNSQPIESVAEIDADLSSNSALLDNKALDGSPNALSCSSGALKDASAATSGPLKYTHLLRLQCDGAEIVRGRSVWRVKERYLQEDQ